MLRGVLSNKDKAVVEQREAGYRYINPLLECDTTRNTIQNKELYDFEHDIENIIKNRLDKNWAKKVSVYFRELNDGLWFSIGEQEKFTIASLRKVPMLITFLKKAESDKKILLQKIRYTLQTNYNDLQAIKPSQVLTPGQDYTIEELLYRMIVYSDNNAFTLLSSIVDVKELDKTYEVFGIIPPGTNIDADYRSVDSYASFFKILYNASYLSRDMSEKALDLLGKSEFRAGILEGVPQNILVAHKFGEHWNPQNSIKELHDCGIVYYPEHPYLLCIMSIGENFQLLDDAIASISKSIFVHVDEQHKKHYPKK
ncbi:MAG: serine hydrolase [Nitrospirae bacterium]|nr:serine hydrolase [Nitrospirota bacterium]